MANNTLLVKTVKGMERSHMRLVLKKALVRGGLAIVSYNSRTLEAGGRNRSRGQVIWISFFNFF